MILFGNVFANNLQITNIELKNQNIANNTYVIEFDVAWLNSWRTSTLESNWDAVYFFIKYRPLPTSNWMHGQLELSGEVLPAEATLQYTGNGKGGLLYRTNDGIGNNNWDDIQVIWNYGTDGLPDDQPIEVSVQGFEMVYIPGGPFYLGDNGTEESGNFRNAHNQAPFRVTSETSIILGGTAPGSLGTDIETIVEVDDDFSSTTTQVLPAAFPKGFNPIYVMKYEISQGAYVNFLNKLKPNQSENRFPNAYGNSGNTINNVGTSPTYTTETPERATNWIDYTDFSAFADWSAMRMMTELEYEKICRGPLLPVPNELATGSPFYSAEEWTITNEGTFNEGISNPEQGISNVNLSLNGGSILRNGVFAASAINPSREETGATYYGVMEMTGNVGETIITTGNPEGRAYTSAIGDGVLNSEGEHNEAVNGWPDAQTFLGTGMRGGAYLTDSEFYYNQRVSNRHYTSLPNSGFGIAGGRLVLNDF